MRFNKGDKVKLAKDFGFFSQGLKGKVIQVSGNDVIVQLQCCTEYSTFTKEDAEEFLVFDW